MTHSMWLRTSRIKSFINSTSGEHSDPEAGSPAENDRFEQEQVRCGTIRRTQIETKRCRELVVIFMTQFIDYMLSAKM